MRLKRKMKALYFKLKAYFVIARGRIHMLSCVNCSVCARGGVARRGGDEVQVMTKCILA